MPLMLAPPCHALSSRYLTAIRIELHTEYVDLLTPVLDILTGGGMDPVEKSRMFRLRTYDNDCYSRRQ